MRINLIFYKFNNVGVKRTTGVLFGWMVRLLGVNVLRFVCKYVCVLPHMRLNWYWNVMCMEDDNHGDDDVADDCVFMCLHFFVIFQPPTDENCVCCVFFSSPHNHGYVVCVSPPLENDDNNEVQR